MPRSTLPIVDVDVHEAYDSLQELLPYLDGHWQRYITEYRFSGAELNPIPYCLPTSTRSDWNRPDDATINGASNLNRMQRDLLDGEGIQIGVLNGFAHFSTLGAWYEFAQALAHAYNKWQIDKWLTPEPRLRGSVHVVAHDPVAAAREIDEIAEHPQIVQVFLPTAVDRQYGDPFYRPIFEAATRNGLAVTMHHGAATRSALGYPRYFVEWHAAIPQAGMCQLTSLIFNGVFDRFPDLRVVLLESGISWLPHLMLRLDQHYRQLRHETPWVKRKPSDFLKENVRVATQPIEDLTSSQFMKLVDLMETDKMLMFATDYPHWDADSPLAALPAGVPAPIRERILSGNALDTFPRLRMALRDTKVSPAGAAPQ